MEFLSYPSPSLDLSTITTPRFSLIPSKFALPTSPSLPFDRYQTSNRRLSSKWRVSFCCSRHMEEATTSKSEMGSRVWLKSMGKGFVGFAAAAAALFSVYCDSPALAESLTVAFPVSRAPEVNRVQRTLVEAWGLIRETFVDPTFNHQDWDLKLQQTMVEMFPLNSADAAYTKISAMLSTLGDPFTRIISPKDYQSFRIESDGNLQGVGLFISVEPNTGHLLGC